MTIHQPDFIPWLGFFDRWERSDLFIILDDVQFIRRGWQHRDKIKTRDGVIWLTVPVIKKGRYDQLVSEVRIDNSRNWKDKHLRTIECAFRECVNFDGVYEKLTEVYENDYDLLVDFNVNVLKAISGILGIKTPMAYSSQFGLTSSRSQRLIELLNLEHATDYLTGTGSREYLDEELFHNSGINVIWQDFEHPVYKQPYGGFVPNLSVIDYLMNRND
ncbi:MAG: WbqC family protein [Planctomycetes bacterium]|nr:WbqC family protein [Planctomycetota bacterium]